jgi:hypothetical protein
MSGVWDQFRRLLLGTVVEALVAEGVTVVMPSVLMAFADGSVFHVPRLDNHMRFVGSFVAELVDVPDAAHVAAVHGHLVRAWPELLATIDLPIGDRLTSTRNDVSVRVDGGRVVVTFDLAAD